MTRTGIGKGHGGSTPNLPVIREKEPHPKVKEWASMGLLQKNVKTFRMGKVSIMLGSIDGEDWHMSISHPERYPTWDEVAKARYELMPHDITVVMVLPSPDDYINVHEFCFQLHQGKV